MIENKRLGIKPEFIAHAPHSPLTNFVTLGNLLSLNFLVCKNEMI